MNTLKKLVIKPTIDCFHNCLYCEDRQVFYKKNIKKGIINYGEGQELQLHILLKVVREAYDLGMRECLISGGDPLLYPHLSKLISGIKQISDHIFVFMNSVGNGLTSQKAKYFLDSGLGAWNFSIDGINEKINDHIRGSTGALKRTLKAIYILREIKNTHHQYNTFWINVMTVVTQKNFLALPKLFEFCINEGISSIFLMHVYGDHERKKFLLNEEQINLWREKIVPEITSKISASNLKKEVKENAINVISTFFPKEMPKQYFTKGYWWENLRQCHNVCNVPEYYSLIEADGTVLPCCIVEVAHSGATGNIYQDSLASIWSNNRYKEFRDSKLDFCIYCPAPMHKTIGFVPELCRQFG